MHIILPRCELGYCSERRLLRRGDLRPIAIERARVRM
jgi:hypothetical protein